MQRAPAFVALLLFVALCASFAYWLLQWFAPQPRAVAAPPDAARPLPSVAAASTLFGGRPQDAAGAEVQLRGILLAGRASIAIIATEGKPARALPVDAEVLPGLTVKQIDARTVLLSQRGVERELSLPPFVAQEGSTASLQAGVTPEPPAQQQAPQPSQPAAAPSSAGGSDAGGSVTGGASPVAKPQPQVPSQGSVRPPRPTTAPVMRPPQAVPPATAPTR